MTNGRMGIALAVIAGAGLLVSGRLDGYPLAQRKVLLATAAAGGGMFAASTVARLRWEVAAVVALLILLLMPGGRLMLEGLGIGGGGTVRDGAEPGDGDPNRCTPERWGMVLPDGSLCMGLETAYGGSVFV